DDVLDHEHVPRLDVDVEVLEDPDDSGRVGLRAVARDRHEVDLAGHRQVSHQVGHEEDGAFEHADQEQIAAFVVGGDLGAELGDSRPQRVLLDQDLADRALELGVHHAGVTRTRASSTIPGTATTSPPRATTGHPSRSARGTFASTKTSWSFFRRPARRSPGRRPRTTRPGSSLSISHGPQRTAPRSSETSPYSRTALIPPPRSAVFDPSRAASSWS